MSGGDDPIGSTMRFKTRFYSDAIRRSDIQHGICRIDGGGISLRAGTQSVAIAFEAVTDLTVGAPPERFSDDIDAVVGIKFRSTDASSVCFIEYDPDHAAVFKHRLFAAILNDARGRIAFGAQRGGRQRDTATKRVTVMINPEQVVFNPHTGGKKAIGLGEIVNLQFGKRTLEGAKRDVIKIDHMRSQTRTTSYLTLTDPRIQRLFNRYIRTEYTKLQAEIEDTAVSEAETQLVIGYYTTHDLKQTMYALTDGNTGRFESIYEEALAHGLVTHPDAGVGLTQKGKLLANTELHAVNS